MSDKDETPLLVEEVEATLEDSSVVVDSDEKTARSKGWKPKEDFEGDKSKWRDAKTFLEKGELIETIHSLKRRAKEHDDLITKLTEHNKQVEEVAYKKALATLRQEHRDAVSVGDVKRAEELTDQLVDMSKKAVDAPSHPVEVVEFLERNKDWFNKKTPENAAMAAFAESLEMKISSDSPDLSPREVLLKVESTVRQKFPSHFRGDQRTVAAVAPARTEVVIKDSTSLIGLPKFQQEMVKTLKRKYKNFDVAAYVKQVKSIEDSKK